MYISRGLPSVSWPTVTRCAPLQRSVAMPVALAKEAGPQAPSQASAPQATVASQQLAQRGAQGLRASAVRWLSRIRAALAARIREDRFAV